MGSLLVFGTASDLEPGLARIDAPDPIVSKMSRSSPRVQGGAGWSRSLCGPECPDGRGLRRWRDRIADMPMRQVSGCLPLRRIAVSMRASAIDRRALSPPSTTASASAISRSAQATKDRSATRSVRPSAKVCWSIEIPAKRRPPISRRGPTQIFARTAFTPMRSGDLQTGSKRKVAHNGPRSASDRIHPMRQSRRAWASRCLRSRDNGCGRPIGVTTICRLRSRSRR